MTPRTRQRSRPTSGTNHARSTAGFLHAAGLPPDAFQPAMLVPELPRLPVPPDTALAEEMRALQAEADDLMGSGRHMPHTNRCYSQRFEKFSQWCGKRSLASLPASPATIVLFLADKGRSTKISTIKGYRAAIRNAHEQSGYTAPYPTDHTAVRKVIAGLTARDAIKGKPTRKAHPISPDELVLCCAALPTVKFTDHLCDEITGKRLTTGQRKLWQHAARLRFTSMLLAGWHGARRVDELVRAERAWITRADQSLLFAPDRQKGLATGFVSVLSPTDNPLICPVRALEAWLALVDGSAGSTPTSLWPDPVIADGKLAFIDGLARQRKVLSLAEDEIRGTRTDLEWADSVESRCLSAEVARFGRHIKAVALKAGIDVGPNRFIGCHSMRRGMVTTLCAANVSLAEIAAQVTGHRNLDTLSGYDDFVPTDHPIARLKL
jgi:hypothetical protein